MLLHLTVLLVLLGTVTAIYSQPVCTVGRVDRDIGPGDWTEVHAETQWCNLNRVDGAVSYQTKHKMLHVVDEML